MKRNKKKGFTLVEIMIVVLIIGILLAIAVPNFVKARNKSRYNTIAATLTKVDAAKEQCAMDVGLDDGEDCGTLADYLQKDPNDDSVWPVGSGADFAPGAIGADATFQGETADQWKTKAS